jgi:hypothetical protein
MYPNWSDLCCDTCVQNLVICYLLFDINSDIHPYFCSNSNQFEMVVKFNAIIYDVACNIPKKKSTRGCDLHPRVTYLSLAITQNCRKTFTR